jgi:hypothetical protein
LDDETASMISAIEVDADGRLTRIRLTATVMAALLGRILSRGRLVTLPQRVPDSPLEAIDVTIAAVASGMLRSSRSPVLQHATWQPSARQPFFSWPGSQAPRCQAELVAAILGEPTNKARVALSGRTVP